MKPRNLSISLLALASLVLVACTAAAGSAPTATTAPSDAMMKDATPTAGMQKDGGMTKGDTMTKPAATPAGGMNNPGAMVAPADRYIPYSPEALANASKNGRAVLFFRADWCPTCRAADAEFRANLNKIPADVTVLRVNYDTEAALKQKYAISYQHTFVQVDASGKQVSRWNGGGLDDLLASLK